MILQFRIGNGASARVIGSARFRVHPDDLAAPLRAWEIQLQKSGAAVGLFGRSIALRAFFKAAKIPFEDFGEALPPPARRRVLVGETTPEALEAWLRRLPPEAEGRLVAFVSPPGAMPGVYFDKSNEVSLAKVTLPVLENLAQSPLSQSALVEILTHDSLTPPH